MYLFFNRLSRMFALLGGLVLSALIILTCLSIVGRSLNGFLHGDWMQSVAPNIASRLLEMGVGPINGDFELVEAGMAFAIFAFLPLCQLKGAHAAVDIFTNSFRPAANRFLRTIIEILFAATLVLIAWQLFQGTLSKHKTGQTTLLLEFPLWWSYALSLSGAVAAASVAVYLACARVVQSTSGHQLLPLDAEAEN